MDSKDTPLKEQARKEAEARYPHENGPFGPDAAFINLEGIAFAIQEARRAAYAAGLIAARQQDDATIAALRAEVEALRKAGGHAVTMAERCIDGAHAGQHSFLPGQYKDWKHARFTWNTLTTKTD